jgi:AraC family transcriptional regulator of arabinose operon
MPGHEEYFVFAEENETWHSWFSIILPRFPDELRARLHCMPWPLPLSYGITRLVHEALALRTTALSTANTILKALSIQMVCHYIGAGELQMMASTKGIAHPAVEQARAFIQDHLSEQLSLAEIAQAAAVSPTHLVRLFRSQLKTTPIAYIWAQRVIRGVELLKQTGLPVSSIAERCGFKTSYHFSRRVRQAAGLAPLEIRRQAWGRGAAAPRRAVPPTPDSEPRPA